MQGFWPFPYFFFRWFGPENFRLVFISAMLGPNRKALLAGLSVLGGLSLSTALPRCGSETVNIDGAEQLIFAVVGGQARNSLPKLYIFWELRLETVAVHNSWLAVKRQVDALSCTLIPILLLQIGAESGLWIQCLIWTLSMPVGHLANAVSHPSILLSLQWVPTIHSFC